MKTGQIVVFRFPQTDLSPTKLRPALLIVPLRGGYGDWLTCMISTKLKQAVTGFDEIIDEGSEDFILTGLKIPSAIRIARLAVITQDIWVKALGEIAPERLIRIRQNLSNWILNDNKP